MLKKKILTETRFELAPTFVDQDCCGKRYAIRFTAALPWRLDRSAIQSREKS